MNAAMHTSIHRSTEHRRRRLRRRGRRAYIRSVYFLPSMATLGNAICGFGAMYVASLRFDPSTPSPDQVTNYVSQHNFIIAAYLIFLAMVFDALDGRLARFARHTTDFGGQLDSLADVISFGAAPAFIALQVFKGMYLHIDPVLSRLIWAAGALYMSCAALRLARFNVSNEHGEQHHFSFLGLPSPGAGGAVAAYILMQQTLLRTASGSFAHETIAPVATALLPFVVIVTGLAMVSDIRYPHVVNRYLRGKRSMARLLVALCVVLLVVVKHEYTLAALTLAYALSGFFNWTLARLRPRPAISGPTATPISPKKPEP